VEYVGTKHAEGRSARYCSDVNIRLRKFAEAFPGLITEPRAKEMREWLHGLPIGPRSKVNFATTVQAMFRFAKREHILPYTWDELHGLKAPKAPRGTPSVFSPEVMELLFARAIRSEHPGCRALVPWLALRAFAGIREAEMRPDRIGWHCVDLEAGFIVMAAETTKCKRWRRIPIQPNLRAWLLPYKRETGPICSLLHPLDAWQALLATAAVRSHNNVLRDSYSSYRLAQTKDLQATSLETGNSPRMIMECYSTIRTVDGQLITPALAEKWFSIMPPADAGLGCPDEPHPKSRAA
jgi:integrase